MTTGDHRTTAAARDSRSASDDVAGALRLASRAIAGRNLALVVVLACLFLLLAIDTEHYVTTQNLIDVALQMSSTGIAAIGMSYLVIAGTVDLSVGSIYGLAAVTAAMFSNSVGAPIAILGALAICAVVGLINGVLVLGIPVSPIVVTLGSLTLIRAVVVILTQGNVLSASPGLGAFGSFQPLGVPISVWLLGLLGIGALIVLRTTIVGRQIYAIGGNRRAALAAGVRVRRILLGAFVFNAMMAGLAGLLFASRFATADPSYGTGFELTVLTAVILGGVAFTGGEGGIGGVVLAVTLLAVINSGLVALEVNEYWAGFVQGAALIVAIGLDQLAQMQRARSKRLAAMKADES